jgi:hypothetical protein
LAQHDALLSHGDGPEFAWIHGGRLEFRGSPTELIAQAAGKVFEVVGSPALIEELEQRESFEIVAQFFRDGKSLLRGVDREGAPSPSAQVAANITLEEAYLAFTLGQGRNVDDSELAP